MTSAVTADFNSDGHRDAAVLTAMDGGSVHLLFGDGHHRLDAGPSLPVVPSPPHDENPQHLAIGHFHPASAPDLAVATNGGPIRVFLNDGHGNFTGPLVTSLTSALNVAVADFDGDGRDDLVTANFDGTVAVALGRGDGTFAPPLYSIGAPASPVDIATGDFDGDGHADVAISNFITDSLFQVAPIVVLAGDGHGRFPTTLAIATGDFVPGAAHLAVADYNHDGIDDIALTRTSVVDVLQGDRAPALLPIATYRFAIRQLSAVAVDLAGNGRASLVVLYSDSLLLLPNVTR